MKSNNETRAIYRLPKPMQERVDKYSEEWGCSNAEALRGLLGLGSFLIDEQKISGCLYYEKDGRLELLDFPGLKNER